MEAEDFQQGWKQKRAAVEGHRSKELRELPQAANEGSRQREAGRASRAKWPRKRGRDALARRCVRGSMPGWDAGEAHRREGEGEGCMHADWPPSPPPDQPARGRRGGDRGGIMRGDWPSTS